MFLLHCYLPSTTLLTVHSSAQGGRGLFRTIPINPGAVEGPGRRVHTLACSYYTAIYHLLPCWPSVWVPAPCGRGCGGLVGTGSINTNLEKMRAETSIVRATVAGGDGQQLHKNINYHIL
jgi:hypothetical protein